MTTHKLRPEISKELDEELKELIFNQIDDYIKNNYLKKKFVLVSKSVYKLIKDDLVDGMYRGYKIKY